MIHSVVLSGSAGTRLRPLSHKAFPKQLALLLGEQRLYQMALTCLAGAAMAVATKDAVLIADGSRARDMKRVINRLHKSSRAEADDDPRFHRPWGWYETLCMSSRFQVKRIMVKLGGILSLQSQMHRSGHWVVV